MAKIKFNKILQNNFGDLANKIAFIVVSTILVTGFVYFSDDDFNSIQASLAGAGHNLSGFAWSENIGWISFNNTTGGGATNYGVNIDLATGNLSGYAWSENIGWIKFDPIGPYPSVPNYSAKLDTTTNQITGWARACSGTANQDCVSASRTDGWDGWIKMAGTALNGSAYGVTRGANCGLSGFAWGSDVVGWIQFQGVATNGSPYGVKLSSCGVGVCGAAHNGSYAEAPAVNLCSATMITPTVVGGGGSDWTWWCSGADGTTSADDVSCRASSPIVACVPSWEYTACRCPEEERDRSDGCGATEYNVECTAPEKNSCRDFNWREVAP